MGFLDRLLGREEPRPSAPIQNDQPRQQPAARSDDEIAVERYRYLLRTAPPETIEQVHEEAFAQLTPEQRALVFRQLSENAPAGEQPRADDPRSLAQSATRAELRRPGTLERSFGGAGGAAGAFGAGGAGRPGGMGFGGMVASSLLGSVAGYVIGSALVSAFLPAPGADQAGADGGGADGAGADGAGADSGSGDAGSGNAGGVEAAGADAGGWDGSGDAGGWDAGGWDGGGGFGDFGGGDFGGGDFL